MGSKKNKIKPKKDKKPPLHDLQDTQIATKHGNIFVNHKANKRVLEVVNKYYNEYPHERNKKGDANEKREIHRKVYDELTNEGLTFVIPEIKKDQPQEETIEDALEFIRGKFNNRTKRKKIQELKKAADDGGHDDDDDDDDSSDDDNSSSDDDGSLTQPKTRKSGRIKLLKKKQRKVHNDDDQHDDDQHDDDQHEQLNSDGSKLAATRTRGNVQENPQQRNVNSNDINDNMSFQNGRPPINEISVPKWSPVSHFTQSTRFSRSSTFAAAPAPSPSPSPAPAPSPSPSPARRKRK